MKKIIKNLSLLFILLLVFQQQQAQVLDVSVINTGANQMQIIGTATAPGFDLVSSNAWGPMNITWRIPKTATVPAPTVAPPSSTPEVTAESSAFTGAAPRNNFDGNTDLSMFDLTTFGQPDDGYWYFQLTGTTETIQNISTGASVVLYEFSLPAGWGCASCVEILTSDISGIPISTRSFIDNVALGNDVLNLVTNLAPLPVRFISFEATKSGEDVKLAWKVTDEMNVKGYHVERSADGRTWNSIGFVAFNPAAAAVKTYTLTDLNPVSPVSYYRIRQEDMDGRIKFSDLRFVRFDRNGLEVRLYPVPVASNLKVNIQSPVNAPAIIRIIDMLGNTVHQYRTQLITGGKTEDINVGLLPSGSYYLEIRSDQFRWSGKFIRQ